MRPKKSLGQHFLANKHILQKIVVAANIKPRDTVLEVGPGTGTLTDELLAVGAHVIAIEKDSALVKLLQEKYRNNKNIEIIESDILDWKPRRSGRGPDFTSGFKIVGNIPYYLTSHLLRTVLETWPPFELAMLMVQKEVAQRMTAKPPDMNMLAVLVQCYCTAKIISIVKRGNFTPVPKVDSAIVKLTPLSTTHYSLLPLAAHGFKHPRKKLANNLPKELLERAGIDPTRRAETLTIDEWQKLARVI